MSPRKYTKSPSTPKLPKPDKTLPQIEYRIRLPLPRKWHTLTYQELAGELGVNHMTLYRQLTGRCRPSLHVVMSLAKLTGLPIEELLMEVVVTSDPLSTSATDDSPLLKPTSPLPTSAASLPKYQDHLTARERHAPFTHPYPVNRPWLPWAPRDTDTPLERPQAWKEPQGLTDWELIRHLSSLTGEVKPLALAYAAGIIESGHLRRKSSPDALLTALTDQDDDAMAALVKVKRARIKKTSANL